MKVSCSVIDVHNSISISRAQKIYTYCYHHNEEHVFFNVLSTRRRQDASVGTEIVNRTCDCGQWQLPPKKELSYQQEVV